MIQDTGTTQNQIESKSIIFWGESESIMTPDLDKQETWYKNYAGAKENIISKAYFR